MNLLLSLVRVLLNAYLSLRGRTHRVERVLYTWDFVVRDRSVRTLDALFLHRATPLLWREDDPRFLDHSIDWESTLLAGTISRKGYRVHALAGWSPLISSYAPLEKMDLIFDENGNLPMFQHCLKPGALKLLYLTGSYPRFQNAAENERVNNLFQRRGKRYFPKRMLRADMFDIALEMADACLLVGNESTAATYPEKFRQKLVRTTISASPTVQKTREGFVPVQREFLWFFGQGAVHKGLDLVIEAFAKHEDWTLHIVGPVAREEDFCSIYESELAMQNIHLHGFMRATSPAFQTLIDRCVAFIAPSCSEGISPAVATCMQAGLYPILSRHCGVSLPPGTGIYLEEASVDAIERAVERVLAEPAEHLREEIVLSQAYALGAYSRNRYKNDVSLFFDKVIAHNA